MTNNNQNYITRDEREALGEYADKVNAHVRALHETDDYAATVADVIDAYRGGDSSDDIDAAAAAAAKTLADAQTEYDDAAARAAGNGMLTRHVVRVAIVRGLMSRGKARKGYAFSAQALADMLGVGGSRVRHLRTEIVAELEADDDKRDERAALNERARQVREAAKVASVDLPDKSAARRLAGADADTFAAGLESLSAGRVPAAAMAGDRGKQPDDVMPHVDAIRDVIRNATVDMSNAHDWSMSAHAIREIADEVDAMVARLADAVDATM